MKWHIVCRIGESDAFLPQIDAATSRCLILHFSGGAANRRVRESVVAGIEERYGVTLSAAVLDLLYACMGAYIADLCIPRRTADDRWSRDLTLHLPVFEERRWPGASRSFVSALRFLTGDTWAISARHRVGDRPEQSTATDPDAPTKVCLLSGGLDSLVGAIDLLSAGEAVAFVSHHGGGLTPKFQNTTLAGLRCHFEDQCVSNQFFVVGPQLDGNGENSMRSRSILFLGLGIAVASALGATGPLIVPENGLISLNVPLTGTRIGSSSTRTTHPHFITCVREMLSKLRIKNPIVLPYRHDTKGEMLAAVDRQDVLKSLLPETMSCSHPEVARWAGSTPGTHCGYCFPCIIRRAAVRAANLEDADSDYTIDIRTEVPEGKRGSDLRAVKMALCRNRQSTLPMIMRVLQSGPLPPDEATNYADVYERGMAELEAFISDGA